MCYINREVGSEPGRVFEEDLWQYIFQGPGWLKNDGPKTAVIYCRHRGGKEEYLNLAPGDVLHANEDAVIIQIVRSICY